MSMPVVTRAQAETYAKEHDIFLMEAKEILENKANFRIRPRVGFRMKQDEDGFYIGTEPIIKSE